MKKKFLLLLSPIAFSISLQAQVIPNGDMENWNSPSGFYDVPNGWGTDNILAEFAAGGNPVSCFKDSVNPHGGNYCARLESVALTNNPASGIIPDTLGEMWTGYVTLSNVGYGYPSTQRPMAFTWWSKYSPMNAGDSGFVYCAITHWNGSSTDTIAVSGSEILASTNQWFQYTTTFYYNPLLPNTLVPDTAIILASATDDIFPRPGSKLWLDDFSFSGWVGVNEFANDNSASVYPNPSSSTTNFEVSDANAFEIVVYDMTGREVKHQNIISNKVSIDSYTLATGIYSYSILTKENAILSQGKFSVTQ